MGLFSNFAKNIGGIVKDSVLGGIAKGVRQTQLTSNLPFFDDGSDYVDYFQDVTVDGGNDFSLFGIQNPINEDNFTRYENLRKYINEYPQTVLSGLERPDYEKLYSYRPEDIDSEEYSLSLPSWNYGDFINERNIFLKHLSTGLDEPGWFYFKIFFDFSSSHGLFGGIMTSDRSRAGNLGKDINSKSSAEYNETGSGAFSSTNSATDYLIQCQQLFSFEKLTERIICLHRFTRLLSYINMNAPWFFKGIKNLAQAAQIKLNALTEEKYIELELDQDAVDMRISTLMSLYKYACYDNINDKEIIPENLRKFDMCILIFSAPIKFMHNKYENKQFKSLYNDITKQKPNSLMSFKLYKLLNCEIDIESTAGFIGDDLKNEQPFALGQHSLKIKYDRVYEYTMNEYMGLMFGSDGIYLDNYPIDVMDVKNLTVLSENKIHTNISSLLKGNSRFVLGNIFGQNRQIYERNVSDGATSKVFTKYAQTKYGLMSNNKNLILNLGYDMLYKLLGTGYNANAEVLRVGKEVIGDGTALNGNGNYRVGSMVWKAKMKRMVSGKTDLSDRELRLVTVGNALHTNWMQNLYNRALNAI